MYPHTCHGFVLINFRLVLIVCFGQWAIVDVTYKNHETCFVIYHEKSMTLVYWYLFSLGSTTKTHEKSWAQTTTKSQVLSTYNLKHSTKLRPIHIIVSTIDLQSLKNVEGTRFEVALLLRNFVKMPNIYRLRLLEGLSVSLREK